jgi:hypothetical protein
VPEVLAHYPFSLTQQKSPVDYSLFGKEAENSLWERNLIEKIRSGQLYPRAMASLLHKIIDREETWTVIQTNPFEVEKVFLKAWLSYSGKNDESQLCDFGKWVVTDLKSTLAKALLVCPYHETMTSQTEEERVVITFKKAA